MCITFIVALMAVPILAASEVVPDETSLDLYKIQPSDFSAKVSYIVSHPDLSQRSSEERKWKVIQEHQNAMRAINNSDCIVVSQFVKKQITNPPPKKVSWGHYPLGSGWSVMGTYYEFMTELSKGKNVRTLDWIGEIGEDMNEYMKIVSEAQNLNYDILWYLDSYMRSLAYYEKYEDLRNMISASFDIQDFIKEGVQKFPRMIPTSRWNTHWLDYAKQALEYLDREDLTEKLETLHEHMKETMDAMTKRRKERAAEMVGRESCVFFRERDDPEVEDIIATIRDAGYSVQKVANTLQLNEL